MMQSMMIGAAFVLLAIASGCQSTKPLNELSYAETKTLFQELHKRCADEGAPMGSKEFDACMQHEVRAEAFRRHDLRERRRRGLMAMGEGLGAVGAQMQRNSVANRQVYCTSTPSHTIVGGPVTSVSTSCY